MGGERWGVHRVEWKGWRSTQSRVGGVEEYTE